MKKSSEDKSCFGEGKFYGMSNKKSPSEPVLMVIVLYLFESKLKTVLYSSHKK